MNEERKEETITTKFDESKIRIIPAFFNGIGLEVYDTDHGRAADTAVAVLDADEVGHLVNTLRMAAKLPPEGYTFAEYERDAARTVRPELSPEQLLLNAALGLAGEAGEVLTAAMELAVKAASMADLVKKVAFHGHPLDEAAKAKLKKEGGDVLWYLALVARVLETTLDDMARGNIDKLKARYPEGFSPEASLNRKPEGRVWTPTAEEQVAARMSPRKIVQEAPSACLDPRTLVHVMVAHAGREDSIVCGWNPPAGVTYGVANVNGSSTIDWAGVTCPECRHFALTQPPPGVLVHRRFGLSVDDARPYRTSCGTVACEDNSTTADIRVTCPECLQVGAVPESAIVRHIATAGGSACGLTVRELSARRGILVRFEASPNCPDCLRQPVRVAHALAPKGGMFRCGEVRPENYNPTPAVTAVSVLCRKCWPTP